MLKRTGYICLLLLIPCYLTVCNREKFIHPDFTITEVMMKEQLEGVSDPVIKENILSQDKEFLDSMKILLALPGDFLILVDKNHGLPGDYEPQDLVSLNDYPVNVTKKSMYVQRDIIHGLLAMIDAAHSEDVDLIIASAYRSLAAQEGLFNYWARIVGPEQAARGSAWPGHSQHHLGTTLDFHPIDPVFKDTEAGKWLLSHASEYGFSLSYPDGYEHITGYIYEPWHYRYVGKEAACVIDKYFLGIQQFFLEFYHNHAWFFREHLKKSPGSG